MKNKRYKIIISFLMVLNFFNTCVMQLKANNIYQHEDYENVFYDDYGNYYDEYGNLLEGPWELIYMDNLPNQFENIPNVPSEGGGVTASTQYYELWNANMVPVAEMTFTGTAKLIDSNGYYYQYLYMYCDTGYKMGDKVSYNYSFEFYAGTNPLDFISSVSVCGNVSEYSISGSLLNVQGVTNTIDNEGKFYVIITFSKKLNGNFMVGPNSTVTLSDDTAAEDEKNGLLNNIIGFITSILDAILNLPTLIFDSFVGMLSNIWNSIKNLPTLIANNLKTFFENIVNAVNTIETWLINLLNGLIDGLKTLFIPNDDYFKNYFDSLYDFFSEKLGILIMPIDILTSLFENISNLDNGDGYIHVPPFEFMGVNLIPKIDYNLKVDVEEVLGNYYDMYYLLTDVIIYFMLFNMAKKKFESIVGGSQE